MKKEKNKNPIIYLGADHAGYVLKEKIKSFLAKKNIPFYDLGTDGNQPHDDYPDYAKSVAYKVKKSKNNLGILICGTGTGMVMAANKINGIRASFAYDSYSAKMSRHDNNANILCLRGRESSDSKNISLVKIWLSSEFSNISRHKRRLKKIRDLK